MNPLKYLKGVYLSRRNRNEKQKLLDRPLDQGIDLLLFEKSLIDPTRYYKRCFQEFHCRFPLDLQRHREYFTHEKRGFGEDAFHVMWSNLFHRYHPQQFLEIGVYRGQTLSLLALIARVTGSDCKVTGISPFDSIGDSVSKYLGGLDYLEDTLKNFNHFKLPQPCLIKAYSTDPEAVAVIQNTVWDCIYIDGNHDYEVVLKDWNVCSESVRIGGIIVMDDSGLSTDFQPPAFATGGHPGPSKMVTEIDPYRFKEVLQVGHNRVFERIF